MPRFTPKILIICISLLVACRPPPMYMGDTDSLPHLLAIANTKAKYRSRVMNGKIRTLALRETALSLGAQAGLAWRAKIINQQLAKQGRMLDTVYDFNSLVLDHNILPPVLLEGRNILNLANEQTIRISDRTYKVAKQAHFITTPPNWRQYLWMDYKKPEYPVMGLLPKNKQEKRAWRSCIIRGWKNGIEQANIILEESIARIKEDFTGMILYRKLLAMNMVSSPYVSHTELGVTGDGSEIHIDDQVLRITVLPALNVNSNEWQAAIAKEENKLEQFKNMEKIAQNTRIEITDKAWQPIIAPVNTH